MTTLRFLALVVATAFAGLVGANTPTATAPTPSTSSVTPQPAPGSFVEIPVGPSEAGMLTTVLASNAKYDPKVQSRICYTDIAKLERGIVNGWIYRYYITGCAIPDAAAGGGRCSTKCTLGSYIINVYVLFSGLDTATVVSIENPTPLPTVPAPTTPAPTTPPVDGGYSSAVVGMNETALLTKALGSSAFYTTAVQTRVCYRNILSLETQIVAGRNYRFHIVGCGVSSAEEGGGHCPSSLQCVWTGYQVIVYVVPWQSTIQVMSIVGEFVDGLNTPQPTKPGCPGS